jgi:ankyrin repeat protein
VVAELLLAGADQFLGNAFGELPLHAAAFTGMDAVLPVLLAAAHAPDVDARTYAPSHCVFLTASLPMCLPHCLLLTVSPTVSLPRRLSPTVSPSPPLSHCVPLAVSLPLCPPLPHRLSPTVSPSPSLSHGVSVPLSLPLTVSLPHGAPSRLLGRTALHLAAAHDRPATLVLLAEAYGADVDAVDQQVRFCRYCCQN